MEGGRDQGAIPLLSSSEKYLSRSWLWVSEYQGTHPKKALRTLYRRWGKAEEINRKQNGMRTKS